MNMSSDQKQLLRRELRSWQIFFIVVGGVVGAGFSTGPSLILAAAGPGAVLLAFFLIGVVAVAVMEGICEMILIWPIPNAPVEFVKAFVDEDFALVVGLSYWYTYAVTFSALIISAVNLADYWNISDVWRVIIFIAAPLSLVLINCLQVYVFGYVEFLAGVFKILFVIALDIVLLSINVGAGDRKPIYSNYLKAGIQCNPHLATNRGVAICIAIPLALFAYLGIELVTMTAFEALHTCHEGGKNDLRWPTRNIAWVTTALYLITAGCLVADVEWTNANLPTLFNQGLGGGVSPQSRTSDRSSGDKNDEQTYWVPIIALRNAGMHAGVITGFLIYSTLSAANTGLYVASRALYGLTRRIYVDAQSPRWIKMIAAMSNVHTRTGSPWWAVTTSALLLIWLPFVRLGGGYTREELQQTLINIGSVSCVLVWSSQCLAYIRFSHFRRMHENELKEPACQRFRPNDNASHLAFFQPVPAYFGLVSTIIICLVFNGSSMWNGENVGVKFPNLYLSPLLWLALWIIFKAWRYRKASRWVFGVDLSDSRNFKKTLWDLDRLIRLNIHDQQDTEDVLSQNFPMNTFPTANQREVAADNGLANGLASLRRPITAVQDPEDDEEMYAPSFIPGEPYPVPYPAPSNAASSSTKVSTSQQAADQDIQWRDTTTKRLEMLPMDGPDVSEAQSAHPQQRTSHIHEGSHHTPDVTVTRSETLNLET